jgi:hypothetical protein
MRGVSPLHGLKKVTAVLTAMTQLEGISEDIVETGVWNGGSIILMVSKNRENDVLIPYTVQPTSFIP